MTFDGVAIVARIDAALKSKGMGRNEALEKLNFGQSTFTDWKNGVVPSVAKAIDVAVFLEEPVFWLFTGENEEGGVIDHEVAELIRIYKRADPFIKDLILGNAKMAYLKDEERKKELVSAAAGRKPAVGQEPGTEGFSNAGEQEEVWFVPLYGKTAAGKPIAIDSDPKGQVPVPKSAIKGDPSLVFAVKVAGNSMTEAGISDSDIAVFRRSEAVDSGKIALVRCRNESTIKRIKVFPDAAVLCWEDGSGKMQTVDSEDYAVQGEYIGVFRK